MATWDPISLLNSMTGGNAGRPAGFQLAENAEARAQITSQSGEQLRRLQSDFQNYEMPDLLSSQAARGAFYSGATQRKAQRASEQYLRNYGDIGTGTAYSLAKLGRADIAANTPGGF
jgi:hypothetical protein